MCGTVAASFVYVAATAYCIDGVLNLESAHAGTGYDDCTPEFIQLSYAVALSEAIGRNVYSLATQLEFRCKLTVVRQLIPCNADPA